MSMMIDLVSKNKYQIERIYAESIISHNEIIKNPNLMKTIQSATAVIYDDKISYYIVPSDRYTHNEENGEIIHTKKFIEIAEELMAHKSNIWSARHIQEKSRRLKKNIYPEFMNREIGSILSMDVLNFLRKIEVRGKYDLAHRIMNDLSQIFRYAITIGLIDTDPTEKLKGALTPHSGKNFTTINKTELASFLNAINHYQGKNSILMALKMMTLTFVRTSELIGARWDEFNLKEKIWTIPGERMKMGVTHIVPLSNQIIDLIHTIRNDHNNQDFLFPNSINTGPLQSNRMIYALYKMGFKNKMTVHGFRSLASTILNENGFNADVIERQLAHIDGNSVRRAYNRAQYLEDRIKMMQWWSNYINDHCPTFINSQQLTLI